MLITPTISYTFSSSSTLTSMKKKERKILTSKKIITLIVILGLFIPKSNNKELTTLKNPIIKLRINKAITKAIIAIVLISYND